MLCSRFATRSWLAFPLLVSLFVRTAAAQEAATGQTPQPAASTAADVERLNEEGSRLFQAGDYRRASERFIEAFGISRDPNLMFNIARCYDELGETTLAIEKYQAFLASKDIDPDGATRARAAIERLRNASSSAGSAQADSSRSTEPATREQPPVASAGTSSAAVTTEPRAPGLSPVFPWLALGLGVASAGAGAVLYTLGASDHDKVTSAEGFGDPRAVSVMTEREASELSDSGKSKKTLGVIGLGVGGTLMAVSVGLFLSTGSSASGHRSAPTARTERDKTRHGSALTRLSFAPGAGGATLLVRDAF